MDYKDLIEKVESLILVKKAEISDLEAALRAFKRLHIQIHPALELERDQILKKMLNTKPKSHKAITKG